MNQNLAIICSPGGLGINKGRYIDALPGFDVIIFSDPGFSSVFSARFYKEVTKKASIFEKALNYEKVLLVTFSAGYGFAREWFKSSDLRMPDFYLSIDSIHGTKELDNVSQFVKFAREKKLFLVHTDIDPYTYASTTDVANYIKERTDNVELIHVPGSNAAAHVRAFKKGPEVLKEKVLPYMFGKREYPLKGVDLSHHQPNHLVKWDRLAELEDFVIARSCYGVREDKEYAKHKKESEARGLKFGAYIFFRQKQTAEEQFEAFKKYSDLKPGNIVPVVDLEPNVKYDGPTDKRLHNERGKRLCDLLHDEYGDCMIYISFGHWQLMGKPDWVLTFPIWTAHWNVNKPMWPKDWAVWQYAVNNHEAYPHGPLDRNEAKELPIITLKDEPKEEGEGSPYEVPKHELLDFVESLHSKIEDAECSLEDARSVLSKLVGRLVD